jgi:hypothetical protein
MGHFNYDIGAYRTNDELAFIHKMQDQSKWDVLEGMLASLPYRKWDDGVDPRVVEAALRLALNGEELSA